MSRRLTVSSDEKPRCTCGHRLATQHRPSTDGSLTCTWRAHRNAAPCGRLLWVAVFCVGGSALRRGTGERIWLVVEVTRDELRDLQDTPRTVLEKLAYLGVAAPGVDLDLLGTAAPEPVTTAAGAAS